LKSVSEKIKDDGAWMIHEKDYNLNFALFSDETVAKYCIKYIGTGVRSNYYLNCKFEVTGKLKKYFEEYSVSDGLTVQLENDTGDDYMDIDDADTLPAIAGNLTSQLEYKRDWSIERIREFGDGIAKLFLFELLK
jgi:hypothetical protein